MTGFGRAEGRTGSHLFAVEVASVNQRGLALSLHLPSEWSSLEPALAAEIRGVISRGKVTVRFVVERPALSAQDLAGPLKQLRDLAHQVGIPGEPDWDVLLRISERSSVAGLPSADGVKTEVQAALQSALQAHTAMRSREGEALAQDLQHRLQVLTELADKMANSAKDGPARQRERLFKRLGEMGLEIDTKDERVLKELALAADRADITEEIIRLRSHLRQASALLKEVASGRALDFLTQELLREVNTVGSKASEIATTEAVLAAKVEIERFREQVQNLE